MVLTGKGEWGYWDTTGAFACYQILPGRPKYYLALHVLDRVSVSIEYRTLANNLCTSIFVNEKLAAPLEKRGKNPCSSASWDTHHDARTFFSYVLNWLIVFFKNLTRQLRQRCSGIYLSFYVHSINFHKKLRVPVTHQFLTHSVCKPHWLGLTM